ncbi:MAG: sodium:solute symporter family protein [Bacteroidia bacterium]
MLSATDYIIIAAYLVLSLGIGLYYRNRAGKSLGEFFLGGRSLPWHIAGISMVATTFAADTPLAVNELVYQKGIAGNWLWWCALFGGMLTTFFFARLWRRSGVMTEVELTELRYGGRPAAVLRGFRAVYLGVFMNVLILGWVNLAMISILQEFFGLSAQEALFWTGAVMLLTALYSSISGLMGVAVTDMVQFVIAIGGCIVLAVIVLNSDQIGGIEGMKEKLAVSHPGSLSFFPKLGSSGSVAGEFTLGLGAFLAFVGVQWWASWYPGAEPGGGGYVAQRMMSAKNEKHAIWATLFFQVAHYCLRPWPWILVGLCSLILYPDLTEATARFGYVKAMKDFLPAGLKGMMLVAFLAAYMSTISTQLNWGASYLVNDLYRRFIKRPEAFASNDFAEKHYVTISRVLTILTMLLSLAVTPLITSISGVWSFIMECGAGLGLVLILRWYWWRINAWSEIAATITPFLVMGVLALCKLFLPDAVAENAWWAVFPGSFFITVSTTTIAWIIITFITKPEKAEVLKNFYDKVRPAGGWEPVRNQLGLPPEKTSLIGLSVCWISAVIFTYSLLFATGSLILHEWKDLAIYAASALAAFVVFRYAVTKTKVFED